MSVRAGGLDHTRDRVRPLRGADLLDTLESDGYHGDMLVMKGKVVSGQVVVEGSLPEGSTVTILAPEASTFTLTPAEEESLRRALAEAERGDVVEADSVLRKLGGAVG